MAEIGNTTYLVVGDNIGNLYVYDYMTNIK